MPLRLKATHAGRQLRRHPTAASLPLTVTLAFSGHGLSVTTSATITLSR